MQKDSDVVINSNYPEAIAKTSTGIPIIQPFTPPIGHSQRPLHAKIPSRNLFFGVFPDDAESKRPASTTINRPLDFVIEKLRDTQNFPIFFENLQKVETVTASDSRWHFGLDVTAPMERVNVTNENLLVWKSKDAVGFELTFAIAIEEAQANRGTVVRIMSHYESKTADILSTLESLFGKSPATTAKKIIQRFKAFCETGNIPTTEGQPSGRDKESLVLTPQLETQTLKH